MTFAQLQTVASRSGQLPAAGLASTREGTCMSLGFRAEEIELFTFQAHDHREFL